jgi:NADH-quinone oxidoreductase subunit H
MTELLLSTAVSLAVVLAFITVVAMFFVWSERKVAGWIQHRVGPMRTGGGFQGWAQSIADSIKLLLKEDLILRGADRTLFQLAPAIVLASAFAMFVVLPFGPGLMVADVDLGVFLILAVASVTTIGVIMAGWGSFNKWSVYGAMREAAQVASYEIPLGLSLMPPIIYFGTFSLKAATEAQTGSFGMGWYIFSDAFWIAIPSFVLFFVAALAENKRAPFDLPEAESELVAGFHTEYSGIRFSFFFLEEYAAMFVFSAVGAVLWFGGWNFPGIQSFEEGSTALLVLGTASFVLKSFALVFVMMWVRWTVPRLRIDQVMTLGYKYLIPLSMATALLAAAWEYLKHLGAQA